MSDFNSSFKKGFSDLAVKIARNYQNDPEEVLGALKNGMVTGALLQTYTMLVKENEITRLEDLPEQRKKELWEKSKKCSDEKFKRIVVCKCIHLLELLTEKQ